MLDYQSADSFNNGVLRTSTLLALWVVPKTAPMKPITFDEEQEARELGNRKANEYRHSRGYVRDSLSTLWRVPPLAIPLDAKPGKSPTLKEGWGHISFSHCTEALLIAWSSQKVGVDIENKNRKFNSQLLRKRYFQMKEYQNNSLNHEEELRLALLKQWVAKEAAIKWQKGKLSKDFKQWEINTERKSGHHKSLGYSIHIDQFIHKRWIIAIAHSNKKSINPYIICQE